MASTTRLADIQLRIWLTEAKLAVSRIVMYVALYAGAGVLGILAIIFLMIGCFRILTDVIGLRPVWAFLIFGALLAIAAGAVVMVASSILNKGSANKASANGESRKDSAAEGKHS